MVPPIDGLEPAPSDLHSSRMDVEPTCELVGLVYGQACSLAAPGEGSIPLALGHGGYRPYGRGGRSSPTGLPTPRPSPAALSHSLPGLADIEPEARGGRFCVPQNCPPHMVLSHLPTGRAEFGPVALDRLCTPTVLLTEDHPGGAADRRVGTSSV